MDPPVKSRDPENISVVFGILQEGRVDSRSFYLFWCIVARFLGGFTEWTPAALDACIPMAQILKPELHLFFTPPERGSQKWNPFALDPTLQ